MNAIYKAKDTNGANHLADSSKTESYSLLNFRKPSWFANYTPPNNVELVGNNHIQRGAMSVLAGPPGIGKSLATTSLAIAGANGTEWFGLKVHNKFKTMILQAENSNSRLRGEYINRENIHLDPWLRISEPPRLGFDFDSFDFRKALKEQITEFKPDLVIFDPWNHIAEDDNIQAYNKAFESVMDVCPTGPENPATMIVAHTRKPDREKKAKGKELMHEISGSHKLYSLPRSAIMLQPQGDGAVHVECCKNNDGETGSLGTWKYQNSSFRPYCSIDLSAIPDKTITLVDLEEILTEPMKNAELVKRLMDQTGMSKASCYEAIKKHSNYLKRDGKIVSLLSAA